MKETDCRLFRSSMRTREHVDYIAETELYNAVLCRPV